MTNEQDDNGTTEFTATRFEPTGKPTPPPMGPDREPITAEVEVERDEGVHELQWSEEKERDETVVSEDSGSITGDITMDGLDVKANNGVPSYILDEYRDEIKSQMELRDQEARSYAHVEDEGVSSLWSSIDRFTPNLEIEAVEGEKAYQFEWGLDLEDGNLPTDKILGSDDRTYLTGEGVINYEEGSIEGDHPEAVVNEAIEMVEEATGSNVETSYQSDFEFPNWRDVRSLDELFEMDASYKVDLEAYDEGLVVAWEGSNKSYDIDSSGEAAYDFEQDEWAAGNPPEMIKSATESIVQFYQSE